MGVPSYSEELELTSEPARGSIKSSGARLNPFTLRLPPPARIPREALGLPQCPPPLPTTPAAVLIESEPLSSAYPSRLPSRPPALAQLGGFDVIGRIAVGGTADVYLAREPTEDGAGRRVALKVLRPSASEALASHFLGVARAAAQLDDPHIGRVYALGSSCGHVFVATEWIDGVPLAALMARCASRRERMPRAVAVSIAAQVAGALDYAHRALGSGRAAIVHGGVHPHNVIVRFDGTVTLLDFALAQLSHPDADAGTDAPHPKLGYIAPERARREPLDHRADIFALGACLYEMLTGRRLYRRDSVSEIAAGVLGEPVPSLRAVDASFPEALDVIVQRALAKNPSQRWETAAAFEAALEDHASQASEPVGTHGVRELMQALYPDPRAAAPALFTGAEIAQRLAPREESLVRTSACESRTSASDSRVRAKALRRSAALFVMLAVGALWWWTRP